MKQFILTILCITTIYLSYAQPGGDKAELKKQREELVEELNNLQKQLKQVEGSKMKSLAEVRVIQDKMATRQKLVNNIGKEVQYIERDMGKTQTEIQALNAKLDTLKRAYAKSIVYAYKNRNNYNFLTFIFSSTSFNVALKRIQYLKSYRNYRTRQAEDILRYKNYLLGKTKELDSKIKEKSSVLDNQSSELNELAGDKNKLDNTIKTISGQANSLSKIINNKIKQQKRISSQIVAIAKREELIRKKALEAERAERKRLADLAAAEAKAKAKADAAKNKVPVTPGKPIVAAPKPKPVATPKPRIVEPEYTQAEVNENASFEQNRGKLPYPLQGSYISTRFGVQDLGGVKFNNEGTTFESNNSGATVVAIFGGVISSVNEDDGTKTIFIKHGKYKSVYANLASSSVVAGQQVTTGQAIGRCAASEEGTGKGVLEFMLFRDNKIENPERWIRR